MTTLTTGGAGHLARELLPRLPAAAAPTRSEFDVTDATWVDAAVAALASRAKAAGEPAVVVHAAASCARHDPVLVHISTDYAFSGDDDPIRTDRTARGGYREDDPRVPTREHDAHTKLLAKDEARGAPARRRKPDVRPASKAEAGVDRPDDAVLDCALWRGLRSEGAS